MARMAAHPPQSRMPEEPLMTDISKTCEPAVSATGPNHVWRSPERGPEWSESSHCGADVEGRERTRAWFQGTAALHSAAESPNRSPCNADVRSRCHAINGEFCASRPKEFRLRALPEPCMTLSTHTAPDVRPFPWHSRDRGQQADKGDKGDLICEKAGISPTLPKPATWGVKPRAFSVCTITEPAAAVAGTLHWRTSYVTRIDDHVCGVGYYH